MSFNHFDAKGQAVMVDISGKEATLRIAVAGATVNMKQETVTMILEGKSAKGDVLGVARLAGIAAAKKTPELIPLAHPLALQGVSVEFDHDPAAGSIRVKATVKAFDRTGVELEEGEVGAGDKWERIRGDAGNITVRGLWHLAYYEPQNLEDAKKALRIPTLGPEWRRPMENRLIRAGFPIE